MGLEKSQGATGWLHRSVHELYKKMEDGAEDAGELPSQEFWRTLAESDPQMGAASARLTEEIASMRVVLRRLYGLVMGASDVNTLVRYAENYGLGCIRLSRLLMSEQGPEGRAAELLQETIDQAILEVNEEWGLDLGGGPKSSLSR